jgi:hypothetical protein
MSERITAGATTRRPTPSSKSPPNASGAAGTKPEQKKELKELRPGCKDQFTKPEPRRAAPPWTAAVDLGLHAAMEATVLATPLGAAWMLTHGLEQIGKANLEGKKLANDRNYVSGFFLALKCGLANPKLSRQGVEEAARFQAPWLKANAELARVDPRRSAFHERNLRAFEAGARAAAVLLETAPCGRERLRAEIERKGGIDRLYADAMRRGRVN